MKTLLEVALQEWAACYDKLLDIYVREMAETGFSDWFKSEVKRLSDIDLEAQRPLDEDLNGILNEIRFFYILIAHAPLIIWERIQPDTIYDVAYLAAELEKGNLEDDEPISCKDLYEDNDDEYDPYCEDVYHDDDPRLFQ